MITLKIRGRNMSFEKAELEKLVESHMFLGPVPGKWFKVNPKSINWALFKEERKDGSQELARKRILETYGFIKTYYCFEAFETLIPEKTWDAFTIDEFVSYAKENGGIVADLDDQALEWAQRISNGETWEEVCNNTDHNPWFRLIEYTYGCFRLVGGSSKQGYCFPATSIGEYDYCSTYANGGLLNNAVPLIVRSLEAN